MAVRHKSVDINKAVKKWEKFIDAAIKLGIYFEIRRTIFERDQVKAAIENGEDLKAKGWSPLFVRDTQLAAQGLDQAIAFTVPGEGENLYGFRDAAAISRAVGDLQKLYSKHDKWFDNIKNAVGDLTDYDLALITNTFLDGNEASGRFYPAAPDTAAPSLDLMLLVCTLRNILSGNSQKGYRWDWSYVNSMIPIGEAGNQISWLGGRQGRNNAGGGVERPHRGAVWSGGSAVGTSDHLGETGRPEVLYPGVEQVLHDFVSGDAFRREAGQDLRVDIRTGERIYGIDIFTPVNNADGILPFHGFSMSATTSWPRTHEMMYFQILAGGNVVPIRGHGGVTTGNTNWENKTGWYRQATVDEFVNQIGMVLYDTRQQPKVAAKWEELQGEVIKDIVGALKGQMVEDAIGKILGDTTTKPAVIKKEFPVPTPFDFQCFLMENIDMLTAYQEKEGDYQNIIKLSGDPGTTISKINHAANTDPVNALLNLTPAVQAALVPYIKIYRVDYDKDPQKMFRPLRQQELPIPNFVEADNIKQLTGKGYGRYEGFGLKSFNWKLDGLQPETVDNNISANLTFYFQSVQDLFKGSLEKGHGEVAGRTLASPLDLLISSRTKERAAKKAKDPKKKTGGINCNRPGETAEYDGANYRIKVIAGWATPPHIGDLLTPGGLNKIDLVRALEKTRVALYLHQTRHKLDFKQDGSVELSIDYQAALTGILTSPSADILGARTGELKDKFKQIDLDLEEAQETIDNFEEVIGRDNSGLTAAQEARKKKLEEKKELEQEERLKKYKRFLSYLYGRTPSNTAVEITPKMHTLQVNPVEFLLPRLGDIKDADMRAAEALRKMAPNTSRGFTLLPPGRTLSGGCDEEGSSEVLLDLVSTAMATGEPIPESATAAGGIFEEKWKQKLGGENIYIPFFFLGDLVDSIMQNNQDVFAPSTTQSDYMTFMGSVDIINPLLLFQAENLEEVACADNVKSLAMTDALKEQGYVFTTDAAGSIKKRVSIASLPISLDVFNIWFKDKIVKPGKTSYYLIHFLKDMCGLISTALGKACYGKNAFNPIRFDTSIVQFQNSSGLVAPGARCTVDTLALAKGLLDDTNDIPSEVITDPEARAEFSSVAGLVVYSTDAKPQSRSGDYTEDLNDGIYHNYIGSSAGILKKINFSRIEQQYLREAKIQKVGALGAEQLRELYSVNMEMVGNTLFKNGQYTFVWPTAINTDDHLAEILGIGGYFMIKGVNHTISSTGYTVSVSALQEGMRYMGGSTATAQGREGIVPPPPPDVRSYRLQSNSDRERAACEAGEDSCSWRQQGTRWIGDKAEEWTGGAISSDFATKWARRLPASWGLSGAEIAYDVGAAGAGFVWDEISDGQSAEQMWENAVGNQARRYSGGLADDFGSE